MLPRSKLNNIKYRDKFQTDIHLIKPENKLMQKG